jgi:molybdate transport system regulatory protein
MARQKKTKPSLHGRLWIEIDAERALTEAGADLLEQIEACGSLSEAARRLHFAYRRAWLLLEAMNRLWPQPVCITSTGGKRGGGAELTEFGQNLLHNFRDVQLQMAHLLDTAHQQFRKIS